MAAVTDTRTDDYHFLVFNSNRMEELCQVAAETIRRYPLPPLTEEWVLVNNRGMHTYLNQSLADANGISMGVPVRQLWDFIWDTVRRVFTDVGKDNYFSHDAITWSLLGLRERWSGKDTWPECSVLRDYLGSSDDPRFNDTRAFELCRRIADTFDQYQMYRPDWLKAWAEFTDEDFQKVAAKRGEGRIGAWIAEEIRARQAKGRQQERIENLLWSNRWQMRLWTLLLGNFRRELESDCAFADRAFLISRLCETLVKGRTPAGKKLSDLLPERVFIFGLSSLSPLEFEFFKEISRYTRVFFMLLNPCREYWGDLPGKDYRRWRTVSYDRQQALVGSEVSEQVIEAGEGFLADERVTGHPLLLGLGRQEMDLQRQLLNWEPGADFVNLFVPVTPEGSQGSNLLTELKRRMLNGTVKLAADERYQLKAQDLSLQIRSCHTRQREVEVLHDAILSLFAQAKEEGRKLDPSEITVMVPQIKDYVPHIEMVFGGAAGNCHIPYAITDQPIVGDSDVAEAILSLLSSTSNTLTASAVLKLLEVRPLAEHFGISEDDVSLIEQWLMNAHIIWALDEQEAEQSICPDGTPGSENYRDLNIPWTFMQGLQRLTMGYMTGELPDPVRPDLYQDIEGDDAEVLGRFAVFVEALRRLRQDFIPQLIKEGLPAGAWQAELNAHLFEEFFELDGEEVRRPLAQIHALLSELNNLVNVLKSAPRITLPVFHAMLSSRLQDPRTGGNYRNGCLNFCALTPMRAVPFRHIFVLGLNEGEFPRCDRNPSFNLVSTSLLRRSGDRSRSGDDRQLFMEVLLSAGESVYFSYLGENPEDQSQMNPSLVLDELLDYLESFVEVTDSEGRVLKGATVKDRLVRKEYLAVYNRGNYRIAKRDEQALHVEAPWLDTASGHLPVRASFNQEAFTKPSKRKLHEMTRLCDQPSKGSKGSKGSKAPKELKDTLEAWPVDIKEHLDVTIEQLASFFNHPLEKFLKNSLHIDFNEYEDNQLVDEEEMDAPFYKINSIIITFDQELKGKQPELAEFIERNSKAGEIPLKGIGRMKLEEELTNKLEFLKNAREKLENISKDDEEHEAHEDFGKASEEHEWTFSCEYRLKPEQPWAQEGAELIEKIRQDIDELTKIQEEINEELRSKRADEDEEDHEEYEDKRIKIMCEMAELLESMMAEDKNSKDNKIVPADRAEREYSVRLYGNVYERGYLEQVDYYKGAGSNRGIIGAFFQAVGMILSEAERKPIKSYIINVKDSAIESIEISDDENERALALAIAKALLSVYVRGQLRPLSEKEIKEEDKKDDKSEKRTGAEDFVFGEVVEGTKKGKTLEKIYQQDADWCKLLIKIIKKRFYYDKI